jgi:hypothetical protein
MEKRLDVRTDRRQLWPSKFHHNAKQTENQLFSMTFSQGALRFESTEKRLEDAEKCIKTVA